jgi:hypothetical protein
MGPTTCSARKAAMAAAVGAVSTTGSSDFRYRSKLVTSPLVMGACGTAAQRRDVLLT